MTRNYFLLDLWQQLTNQICMCKHTKRHHIKLAKDYADRSDVQCLDFVFTGGAFGENGRLGCCQCLSYHQREISFGLLYYKLKNYLFPITTEELERRLQHDLDTLHCVCGHTAREHDIGNQTTLYPLYPPCIVCKCKEYDYVNNPRITNSEIQPRHGVEQ